MISKPQKILAKVLNVAPESIPCEMVLERWQGAPEELLNELEFLLSARWPYPRQMDFLALT
jgi:hypothetical protein